MRHLMHEDPVVPQRAPRRALADVDRDRRAAASHRRSEADVRPAARAHEHSEARERALSVVAGDGAGGRPDPFEHVVFARELARQDRCDDLSAPVISGLDLADAQIAERRVGEAAGDRRVDLIGVGNAGDREDPRDERLTGRARHVESKANSGRPLHRPEEPGRRRSFDRAPDRSREGDVSALSCGLGEQEAVAHAAAFRAGRQNPSSVAGLERRPRLRVGEFHVADAVATRGFDGQLGARSGGKRGFDRELPSARIGADFVDPGRRRVPSRLALDLRRPGRRRAGLEEREDDSSGTRIDREHEVAGDLSWAGLSRRGTA